MYRLYCGAYCQSYRARGTADRLLVTIAIAAIGIQHYTALLSEQQGQRYADTLLVTITIEAIDIQHYTSTERHKMSVSAVQLLPAVNRDEIQGFCVNSVYGNLQLLY